MLEYVLLFSFVSFSLFVTGMLFWVDNVKKMLLMFFTTLSFAMSLGFLGFLSEKECIFDELNCMVVEVEEESVIANSLAYVKNLF